MPQGQFVQPSPVRVPTAAEIAIQYRVQHHEGYRYNPAANAYEPDVGNVASVPAVPVGVTGHPAPTMPAPNFPATVSPSNPVPPGVTPQPSFLHGGAPR
jgi:hypothetical protein